jgi:monovalent cation:proton antiporter-2 (CPA2) family protein
MEPVELLTGLAIVWLAARAAGELAERVGQPAVLGELIAGLVIGPGALGLVADSEVLHALAEIGVVLLLFEIGLESDLGELLRAGAQSTAVAVVGIVCPFVLGAGLSAWWWGVPWLVAVFIGASLTATSVGITARVLSDLGRLADRSAQVILGAAIIDDVLGLVILAVVSRLAEPGRFSAWGAALILVEAIGFLVVAIAVGIRLAPRLLSWVDRMRARGALIVSAVLFCVALAALAGRLGLAPIIGAFAAGLALARTDKRAHIDEQMRPVVDLFVPIFFVSIGLKVDLARLNPFGADNAVGPALLLTAVAVVSKLATGLAVYQRGIRRWPVAVGMIPRGEVGLIFAGIGLAAGLVEPPMYAALVVMVMVSTFIVPPWLERLYRPAR